MTNKEAIKRLENCSCSEYMREAINYAIKALEERQQGEWKDDKEYPYFANCSICGYQMDTHEEHGYFNFCPNCGADMREAENEI